MLKRCPNIALFALALCFAIGFGAEVWRASKIPHPSINQSTTAQKEHHPNSKTIEERHQATEEAIAYYNKWLMFFTAILAVATLGLGTATVGLYFAGERQLRLARDEFLSTHRPKIRIKNIWLMNNFGYDSPIEVKVVCVNVGTTDARIIEYGVDFLVIRKDATIPPEHKFSFKNSVDTIVKPGVSAPMPKLSYVLTEQNEIAIRQWKSAFYCVGYLHYLDKLKNARTTAFCRILKLDERLGRPSGRFISSENADYEYQD